MGNETSSANQDQGSGENLAPLEHASGGDSPIESNAPAPVTALKTSSGRFSSLFRSQNVGGTTNKSSQHSISTNAQMGDLYNRPQMDNAGTISATAINQRHKEKVPDLRPGPLNQRQQLVDGDHGPQHLQAQTQYNSTHEYAKAVNHPLQPHPQRSQFTGAVDPRSGDISQSMMNMSPKTLGDNSHQLSGTGPPVPMASTMKHHQHSSTGSLGRDLDAWENAWEEDDESSEGEDGMDDHDAGIGHHTVSSKVPALQSDIHASTIPFLQHTALPQGSHGSLIPIDKRDTNVSMAQLDDEVKTLSLEANKAMNGIAWDTYSANNFSIIGNYERPSVQMFLPLLRVLGKGSFGKVNNDISSRIHTCYFDWANTSYLNFP